MHMDDGLSSKGTFSVDFHCETDTWTKNLTHIPGCTDITGLTEHGLPVNWISHGTCKTDMERRHPHRYLLREDTTGVPVVLTPGLYG